MIGFILCIVDVNRSVIECFLNKLQNCLMLYVVCASKRVRISYRGIHEKGSGDVVSAIFVQRDR